MRLIKIRQFNFLCCSQNQIADLIELESLASTKAMTASAIDFYPNPSCPFYSYPVGALSPYGDELLPVLESLVQENGTSDTCSLH